MPSTWVYLIRHGEVERAGEGRFFGSTDVSLSATGLAQVEALARQLALEPIEAVYASDLVRARHSAAPLAAARDLTPVIVPALREMAMGRWEGLSFREMAMGRWEGLSFREIREREPEAARAWRADLVTFPFPGGENVQDLRRRVMPAVADILARDRGRRVAVVAHGGVNRVVLCEALGMPLSHILRLAQDYASWSLIEYRDQGPLLHTLNQRVAGIAAAAPVEKTAIG